MTAPRFVLLCVALCSRCLLLKAEASYQTPQLSLHRHEPLRDFYEKVYPAGQGRIRPDEDSGEPLILTPYIAKGQYEEAKKLASVDPDLIVPDVESYSGYLTVDKSFNSNLWFWYFPVNGKNVGETPLIIWLQGGPGASSLYGLFSEIGPFTISEDGSEIIEREYSWNKNHSLLFIDNPVGTGFSFTDHEEGYATNQDQIGSQLYVALQQFLTLFSELRSAPLFIAGESYAGKHIPSLAINIHRHKKTDDPPINLQGLAIGNGFIDPLSMLAYSAFAEQTALVDSDVAGDMLVVELLTRRHLKSGNVTKAFRYFNHILGIFLSASKLDNLYNYIDESPPLAGNYQTVIQQSEVRKALHVGSTNYTSIGIVYEKLIPDFMKSAKPWLEELLEHYRVMCYSGQLDIIVASALSARTYAALNWSARDLYHSSERQPWYHNGQLAGYHKSAGNFSDVLVRNAGHMVPADQPAWALGLISAFVQDINLSKDTGPLASATGHENRRRSNFGRKDIK